MVPPLLDSKLFLISLMYLLFSLFPSQFVAIFPLPGKATKCLLGHILYNTTLRFFWANISCSFTKLLVLLRLNFWLKFWLKFFGVVNLYILLSLFLINASTDLAQIFRGPSLCYVSYVCYVCHVILFLDNSS